MRPEFFERLDQEYAGRFTPPPLAADSESSAQYHLSISSEFSRQGLESLALGPDRRAIPASGNVVEAPGYSTPAADFGRQTGSDDGRLMGVPASTVFLS